LFLDNSKEKEDSALLIESPFLASFFKKLWFSFLLLE
jgi:hypothetical protein